ncbi:MAG: hypothetical protein K8R68_01645, partial [Bacteroidales bacterium]|nr:hypothetical protein [Bacteroidales bacterium]
MSTIKNIILFCVLFIPLILYAQSYYFSNMYQSASNSGSSVHSLIEIENGYLIGGGTGTPPNNYWIQISIMILDFEGNKIDEKLIGDTTSQYFIAQRSLIKTYDDLLTFAGSRRTNFVNFPHDEVLLVKLDNEYDTLWSKFYGEKELPYDSAYNPRHIIEISDSNLVMVGTMVPEINFRDNVFLIKTDSEGNKLSEWFYSYPGSAWKLRGFSVIETPDKGFAIGAYRFKPGFNYTGEPMVYKVDSLGNEVWFINVGGPYYDTKSLLCNAYDGNIIEANCYADSMS